VAGLATLWSPTAARGPSSAWLHPQSPPKSSPATSSPPRRTPPKWFVEHRRLPAKVAERDRLPNQRRPAVDARIACWQPRAGQLLIIDQTSRAGAFTLDELVTASRDAGTKVLLVEDWAKSSEDGP
jgi:hypothetical protein